MDDITILLAGSLLVEKFVVHFLYFQYLFNKFLYLNDKYCPNLIFSLPKNHYFRTGYYHPGYYLIL